jgi:FkbM family methyltransferase
MITMVKRFVKATPLATPLRRVKRFLEWRQLPDGVYREVRDDAAIQDLLRRTLAPDSVCVDVGSNTGRILGMMVETAPRARHIAVEALPHLAAALTQKFPHVTVHGVALSDKPGTETFQHVVGLPGWSGFHTPSDPLPPGKHLEEIRVTVKTLDEIVPKSTVVRLIKIDVEGAELQVLRGAIETIRRCRPTIVFEYGEGHSRTFGTTPDVIYDYLTDSCGLVVRSLHGRNPMLTRSEFIETCQHATRTNYDRESQGNFIATPE